MNREIHKYLRKVAKKLPLQGAERKRFLKDLKSEIISYTEECPDVTESNLIVRFGDADGIAAQAFDELDYKVLQRMIHKGKAVTNIAIATASFLLVTLFALMIVVIQKNANRVATFTITMGDQTNLQKEEIETMLRSKGWSDDTIAEFLLQIDGE